MRTLCFVGTWVLRETEKKNRDSKLHKKEEKKDGPNMWLGYKERWSAPPGRHTGKYARPHVLLECTMHGARTQNGRKGGRGMTAWDVHVCKNARASKL